MGFQERSKWASGIVALGAFVVYVVLILQKADGGQLTEVAYQSTLIWVVAVSVVATVVSLIVVAIATAIRDREAVGDGDERDKTIERHGEYRGWTVAAPLLIGPLALAMLDADHFWVANSIYAALVIQNVASTVTKIVAYRRGLPW